VLGAEVATDDVLAAWGAAYGQLADILIGAEEQIYQQNAAAEGGWRGARQFKVARRRWKARKSLPSCWCRPMAAR
jgi:nitric oxide dioxygenase